MPASFESSNMTLIRGFGFGVIVAPYNDLCCMRCESQKNKKFKIKKLAWVQCSYALVPLEC